MTVVEFVQFKLKKGSSEKEFLAISDKFQKEYLEKRKGYMSRTLSLNGDKWLDIVVWASMEEAKAAMEAAYNAPEFQAFGSIIDEENCSAEHYTVIRND